MSPDFKLFWSMCNYAGPKQSLKVVVKDEPQIAVQVQRCIGHGASSFVYEAVLVEEPVVQDPLYLELKTLKKFALKIIKANQGDSWFTETEIFSQLKEKQLQSCCVFPIRWGSHGQPFVLYPLGKPVFPTVDSKAGAKSPLKVKHFAGLLNDLMTIHQAGFVHRDIRLANILMVGDSAKLIDFGYATAPTTSTELLGTQATASQAVLEAVLRNRTIFYKPEDDLESLLKVFLMHEYGFKIDYGAGKMGVWTIYAAWMKKLEACEAFNEETRDYAKMVAYLKKLFANTEQAWQAVYREEALKQVAGT